MSVKKNFVSRLTRTRLLFPLLLIVLLLPALYWYTTRPKETAAWWNESWGYRTRHTINNSGSSISEERKIKLDIDTASLITAGKLKSDCSDARFTDQNGQLLDFFIDTNTADCNNASTDFYIKLPSIISGEQNIYFYYSNPSASSVKKNDFFATDSTGQGLIGYWRMEDNVSGAGQTITDYATLNHGTTSDNNASGMDCTTTGKVGNYSCTFDRTDDYISLENLNVDTSAGGKNTVAFWMYWDGTQGKMPFGWTGYDLWFNNNCFGFNTAQSNVLGISTTNIPSETWVHVITTFYNGVPNINDNEIYINGVKQTLSACTGSTTASVTASTTAKIGVWNNLGSYYFGGKLDDFRMYSRALTQNEASSIYNSGQGAVLLSPQTFSPSSISSASEEIGPGPIIYLKLDEGTGTTANDSSSNMNHGTINSATWSTEDQCISGKCLYFDGTGDYINNIQLPLRISGSQAHTVSIWFKTGADSSGPLLMLGDSNTLDSSGNADAAIGWESGTGNITTTLHNGSGHQYVTTSDTYRDNQWHLLTSVLDSSSLKLYIDGVFVAENTSAKTTAAYTYSSSPYFWIATRSKDSSLTVDNVQYYSGYLDELKIYPYARTEDQVLQDYNQYANSIGGGSNTLSDGLIGYWKMDESNWNGTSNEVIDTSSHNHHGTAAGNATTSSGKYGNGGNLDGTGDYITAPYHGDLDYFTASAWVYYPDQVSYEDDEGIFTSGTAYNFRLRRQNTAETGWRFELYNENNVYSGSTACELTGVQPDRWNLLTVSYDGEKMKGYLNGDLNCEGSVSLGPVRKNNQSFYIGTTTPNSLDFNGKIDEFRLYNRALTSSEVESLYHYAPGPVGYWKLDDAQGDTADDSSGQNNTATLQNSPNWSTGKVGNAISLDGNNQYLSINDNDSLEFISQATLEGWVYLQSINPSSYTSIVGRGDNVLLTLDAGGAATVQCWHKNSSDAWFSSRSSNTVPTNQWVHLACVYKDDGKSYIYINGTEASYSSQQTRTGDLKTTGTVPYYIGRYTDYTDGIFDEIKIYNYARTTEQIRQDMTGTANPSSSSNTILPQPITYWPFDEQTGQTAYDKYGSNNGTLGANSSLGSDDPTWKTTSNCKINGCLHFDGTDDFITIPTISQVDANQSYTISLWFNQDSTSGIRTLFNNYASSTRNGILISGSSVGGGHYISSYNITSGTFSTNTWNHIAYVNDNGTVKNYLNGRLVTGGSLGNLGTNSRIGYTSPNGNYFNGYIDEIKVYNSALTLEQIKQDMNTGSTLAVGTTTSEAADLSDGAGNPPILEWKLDEKTGTTANDTSGNNNTGSATNTTWKSTKDCKQGACLSFTSSSSSYVTTSTDPGTMASGTYSLWVKPSTLSANMGWIDSTFDIFQWTGNILYFRAGNQSSVSISNWNPNTWYHLALVWNGTNYYGYVNGKQVTSGTQSGSRTGQISIGRVDGGYYFTGLIDHVKIYNYARTPAQIAYDYNRGDPIAHWKMDECQGSTIHDSSDNSNHGTLTVTTTGGNTNGIGTCTTSTSAWGAGASGKFGASLNFDGDGDYIDLASDLGYTNQVSAFAWFKSLGSPAGGYHIIFGGQELEISIPASTGEIRTGVFTSARYVSNHGSGLTDGNWHHIGFTFDGSTKKSYIDGVYVGQQTGIPGTLTSTFSNRRIGRYGSSATYYANGLIDDARIYNYVLSEAQVKKIMNEGSALRFGD